MPTRNIEERRAEARKVVQTVNDLKLGPEYAAITSLYKELQRYTKDGVRIEIKIDFPEFGRRIKGVLATSKSEEVWVMMEQYN
jgi:hypothetical protein